MDSFFGIGIFELVVIAVIALIVLGPERLPGAMREVGKYARQVRDISNEFQGQFSEELKMLDELNPRKIISGAMDPTTAPPPAKPPAATPAAQAAKPAAAAKPATAVKPPPAATAPSPIVNGDSGNTILPPAKEAPAASAPAAEERTTPETVTDPEPGAEESR